MITLPSETEGGKGGDGRPGKRYNSYEVNGENGDEHDEDKHALMKKWAVLNSTDQSNTL